VNCSAGEFNETPVSPEVNIVIGQSPFPGTDIRPMFVRVLLGPRTDCKQPESFGALSFAKESGKFEHIICLA